MKEYVYRKHLREPIKLIAVIMVLLVSMILEIGIIYGLRSGTGEGWLIFATVSISAVVLFIIVGLELLILYHILFKKFKNISISLNDEGITYNNIKGTQFIDYKSIQAIKFPSMKYLGGWVKIKSSGQTIRLTVVLENIGEFVKELKEKLDERGMSNLYNDKKLYNFCKTGIYIDHSWARLYEKMKISSILYFVGMILAIVYSDLINKHGFALLYTLLLMLYPFIVYIVGEIILSRKFSNKVKQEGHLIYERDRTQENTIYRNIYIALGILIVIFLIVSAI